MGYLKVAPGESLESVVNRLLEANARGEDAYADFGNHTFYADTVTMDDAYRKVYGWSKETFDEIHREMKERKEQRERLAKERYERLLKEHEDGKPITMEVVIAGLKFIAENQSISQDELFDGLMKLGCTFTLEDIKEQFPEAYYLRDGIKNGEIAAGAGIIANMRKDEEYREMGTDKFLRYDDDESIYHFIRVATNDPSYTKEYAETQGRMHK